MFKQQISPNGHLGQGFVARHRHRRRSETACQMENGKMEFPTKVIYLSTLSNATSVRKIFAHANKPTANQWMGPSVRPSGQTSTLNGCPTEWGCNRPSHLICILRLVSLSLCLNAYMTVLHEPWDWLAGWLTGLSDAGALAILVMVVFLVFTPQLMFLVATKSDNYNLAKITFNLSLNWVLVAGRCFLSILCVCEFFVPGDFFLWLSYFFWFCKLSNNKMNVYLLWFGL